MTNGIDKLRVALWGFGAMGQGIAKLIASKSHLEIVGVCDINPDMVGKSLEEIIGESSLNNVFVEADIDLMLQKSAPTLVMISTDSFVRKNYDKIMKCIKKGYHVISSAEEMAQPYANNAELAISIDEAAKANGVTVLGTGVNPGFMMDLLAISMTGVTESIKEIHCRRVNSLSPFGKTVMEEQGIGISLEEFDMKLSKNLLSGHVGFKESTFLFAQALGNAEVIDFEETMAPILTDVERKSKYGYAAKGTLAGIDMRAKATLSNGIKLFFKHPQQIEPQLGGVATGDYIKILGVPEINLSITPEVDGGIGTIAICVNMIPLVVEAESGLKTMVDLPVPRALINL